MKEIRPNNNRQWFINDTISFQNGYALVRAFNLKGKSGWSIIDKTYQEAFDDDYFKFENHIDLVKVYNGIIITKKLYIINNQYISEYKMWIIKDNVLEEIPEEEYLQQIFERTSDRSSDIALISEWCAVKKLDVAYACPPLFKVYKIENKEIEFVKNELDHLWINLPNVQELSLIKSKIIQLKNYI